MRAALAAAWVLAACGGAQSTSGGPIEVDGVCKIDPAVAPGRASKPETVNCLDAAAYSAVRDACNGSQDPVACFQAAECVNGMYWGLEDGDPRREEHLTSMLDGFRIGCDGKIAESCVNLAAVAEMMVKNDRARSDAAALTTTACEGYRAACHLGEEVDGCGRCLATGCSGLPGIEPAVL